MASTIRTIQANITEMQASLAEALSQEQEILKRSAEIAEQERLAIITHQRQMKLIKKLTLKTKAIKKKRRRAF